MGRVYYPQARAVLSVIFDGFGARAQDSSPLIIPVVPKEVTVHVNAYMQPDTFELVFDAHDLLIDPSMIRSGSANIYLYHTRDGSSQRILNRQFTGIDATATGAGDPLNSTSLTMDMKSRDEFTYGQRPRIVGLFDSADIDMSSSGKWISISGQDFTAFLAAKQWPPKAGTTLPKPLPVGQRLDIWIRDRLWEADEGHQLDVLVEGVDVSSLPIVGSSEIANKRLGIPIESDTTYWDAIYKVVTRYGYICFVRGMDVILTRPKNIENLATHSIKRLAWGRNLESVKVTRKLGKEKVPRIILNAYDPATRKRVVVEYPENVQAGPVGTGIVTGKVSTSKQGKVSTTDEYQIIPVYGISDKPTLQRMAENLFQLLGKSERTIVATTRDLTDIEDATLMDLNTGDAVEVEWLGLSNDKFLAGNFATPAEKLQHLEGLGYSSTVAAAIVENYQKLVAIKRPMRLKTATYKYSVDDGIAIEVEVQDFVVADGAREMSNVIPRGTSRPDRVQGKNTAGQTVRAKR